MVTIATGVRGIEVRVACMENVESSVACEIDAQSNFSASDTLLITNADQFRNSMEFRVKNANWETIPASIFTRYFPKLHRIEMSANIKNLTGETFSAAQDLNTIQLVGNQIEEILRDTFVGASNLRIIGLASNKIQNIEDGAFNGLEHLSHLHCSRNGLRIIRNGTFVGAPNLRRIELGHNQIETIETNALQLPYLDYIDLGHNNLKALAADIFNIAPMLKALILNDNELSQMNELVSKLSLNKLSTLVLANNPADRIDLALTFNLPKLENLNVRNTTSDIRFEKPNATKAVNDVLEAIDLSYNNLNRTDILSMLRSAPNLVDLNLELNLFTKIDGLGRIEAMFPELRILYISCNLFECQWLTHELESVNAKLLDVLSCPEPTINDAKNVKNVDCV